MTNETQGGGVAAGADMIMARIGEAIALGQQGERAAARTAFAGIWADLGSDGDPLHRCTLAHHMADVQDDPREELVWDLRALAAAESVTDARASAAGATGPVAAFYPSLHLNLGEDHRKLGNAEEAHRHLELGRQAAASLGDDPYGSMIRRGLDGLAERLAAPGR
ncbi:MAG TPA: hypothetical protein VGN28_08745 [Blastococcus sp.]|jgi:hypothetical protein|nr:hypothetical protein [Blastococcus sp.]